jgi:hypothetical protein
MPDAAGAQTDYFNTDPGRPLRTADAYPVEYRALELQLAPLRVERSRGGNYHWALEPGITAGLLPRTQVELHLPIAFIDQKENAAEPVSAPPKSASCTTSMRRPGYRRWR